MYSKHWVSLKQSLKDDRFKGTAIPAVIISSSNVMKIIQCWYCERHKALG